MNLDAPRPAVLGALALAVTVLVLAGIGSALAVGRQSPLERALSVLADDDSFTRASDAGAAVLQVSLHVEDAADRCSEPARCDDLDTALATTRVGAVSLLRCGRPEIVRFRGDLVHYLEELRNDGSPQPPPTPSC